MGRESSDRLCFPSAAGSRRGGRGVLRLPTVPGVGLPVLRPGSVRGWSRSRPDASSHHHLWPHAVPGRPLLPRHPTVGERGVVGRNTLRALATEIVPGEQRGLRNHILPRSHSRWGVRVGTSNHLSLKIALAQLLLVAVFQMLLWDMLSCLRRLLPVCRLLPSVQKLPAIESQVISHFTSSNRETTPTVPLPRRSV